MRTADSIALAQGHILENSRLTVDEFLVLVPIRAPDEIEAEIERARRDEEAARSEKQKTEALERMARDQYDAQKREIDAIKARMRIARNDGNDAELVVLESDKKLAEGAKELLERRRELRREEITGWDTVIELARGARKTAELELQLGKARADRKDRGSRATVDEARRLRARVDELERRTLEAARQRAQQRARVARTEEDVMNARLRLLKSRAKLE